MSIDWGELKSIDHLFGNWQMREKIGEGSDSVVYRLENERSAIKDESAVKVIRICETQGNGENFSQEEWEAYESRERALTAEALQEAQIMHDLRGNTNVVDYFDSYIQKWLTEEDMGCDLLIRQELLYNLAAEQQQGIVFPESEIICLGKDICNALILCHKKNIIHRDIKPANIYWNRNYSYKLGDFGIARFLNSSFKRSERKGNGTLPYMAPEQYKRDVWDVCTDVYSLGLVLYELANNNRLPFAATVRATEAEVYTRLRGKEFPPPEGVGETLAEVIMKACAYEPEARYQSALEFWKALDGLSSGVTGRIEYQKRYREYFEMSDLYRTCILYEEEKEDAYATLYAGAKK